MRLLILGGTVFLGRHLANVAAVRGHTVTIFHRGQTNPDLFPNLETLHGDRDEGQTGLAALEGRTWDAVIDTCGYLPGVVATSAKLLAKSVRQYCFISTISVLSDTATPDQDEDTELAALPDGASAKELTPPAYGALKALCEQEVTAVYGDRARIVRPGLIVGPWDPTDRFTYWPRRVAQGGSILVGPPEQRVQFIDVRDLSEWIVRVLEANVGGTWFATGPKHPTTMADVAMTCQAFTKSFAEFVHVPDDFLLEHDVVPFTGLPLWLPSKDAGFLSVDVSRAVADGLVHRPLGETIVDTHNWDITRGTDDPVNAGITMDEEARLIAAWNERGASL